MINREQNSNNNNNNTNRQNIEINGINGYTNGQSRWSTANLYDNAIAIKEHNIADNLNSNNRSNWSNQNVYVQPPTRGIIIIFFNIQSIYLFIY